MIVEASPQFPWLLAHIPQIGSGSVPRRTISDIVGCDTAKRIIAKGSALRICQNQPMQMRPLERGRAAATGQGNGWRSEGEVDNANTTRATITVRLTREKRLKLMKVITSQKTITARND
jgi:hypothetical protein